MSGGSLQALSNGHIPTLRLASIAERRDMRDDLRRRLARLRRVRRRLRAAVLALLAATVLLAFDAWLGWWFAAPLSAVFGYVLGEMVRALRDAGHAERELAALLAAMDDHERG